MGWSLPVVFSGWGSQGRSRSRTTGGTLVHLRAAKRCLKIRKKGKRIRRRERRLSGNEFVVERLAFALVLLLFLVVVSVVVFL